MKLNPTKCLFGVSSGKFQGYMVTQQGIEANPNQIQSVMNIPSHSCIKDVQGLVKMIIAINYFISKSLEKYHLFFANLCNSKDFEWTSPAKKYFSCSRDISHHLHCYPKPRLVRGSTSTSLSTKSIRCCASP